MAYADLNERAVLALYERLSTTLSPTITAINAATAADLKRNQTMISQAALVLDSPPVVAQLTQFPVYAIADGNMRFTDDVGWGATGEYEMYGLVYDSDPDPTVLGWKLRRDLQALVTCITASRNMQSASYSGGWGAVVKQIIPGRRLSRVDPSGATQLLGWACAVLTVKDEQNYP